MTASDGSTPLRPADIHQPRSWRSAAVDFARSLAARLNSLIRAWAKRHRDRRELLYLLAEEHRIAADLRSTEEELKAWAHKPFWRP
jgi:hypothetical protein